MNEHLQEAFDRKLLFDYVFNKLNESTNDVISSFDEEKLKLDHIYINNFYGDNLSVDDIRDARYICAVISILYKTCRVNKIKLNEFFKNYTFQVHSLPKVTIDKLPYNGRSKVRLNVFNYNNSKPICISPEKLKDILDGIFGKVEVVKQLEFDFSDDSNDEVYKDIPNEDANEKPISYEMEEYNSKVIFRTSKGGIRPLWRIVNIDGEEPSWMLEKLDYKFPNSKYNLGELFEGIVASILRYTLEEENRDISAFSEKNCKLSDNCKCRDLVPLYIDYAKVCARTILNIEPLKLKTGWHVIHKFISDNYSPSSQLKISYNNEEKLWSYIDPSDIYIYREDNPFDNFNKDQIIKKLSYSINSGNLVNISLKGTHGKSYKVVHIADPNKVKFFGGPIWLRKLDTNNKSNNTFYPLEIDHFYISYDNLKIYDVEDLSGKDPTKDIFCMRVGQDGGIESTLSGRSYQLGKAGSLFSIPKNATLVDKSSIIFNTLVGLLGENTANTKINENEIKYDIIDENTSEAFTGFLKEVLKLNGLGHYIVYSNIDGKLYK